MECDAMNPWNDCLDYNSNLVIINKKSPIKPYNSRVRQRAPFFVQNRIIEDLELS